jgi:hypothetical protein
MENDNMKRVLAIFSFSMMLIGCASFVTIEKMNAITKKQFQVEWNEEVNRNNKIYENDPSFKNGIFESEKHRFNNALTLRNKVIDSLNVMSYNKSIIIESTKDLNGMLVTAHYFFFNNKIFSAGYNVDIIIENGKSLVKKEIPVISETTIKDLTANYQNDVLEIYNHFNQDSFSKIKHNFVCTPSFGSYKVTLIIGNKIGYYGVLANENCKVSKYN